MAPTICFRDVSHKLHRRQQKQQLPIDAASSAVAENVDEVMTAGSGGGMSLAGSGRNRMVAKNNPRAPKNAAIRRRRRRGVVWLLHEIEDSRISTTTANSETATVTKDHRHGESTSAEEYDGSDVEAEMDSRVGRLTDTIEGPKRPGGLLGITMRTVELIRRNQLLQWRLSMLQEETRAFVKSVMSNPENQRVEGEADSASDGAQDPSVSGSC